MIHLESCIETLKKDITYNYVLTSPPDYNELGIPAHTNDWEEFLTIKEKLALKIKQEVEKIGLGFAFPSQSVYIENLKKEDISKI